MMVITLPSTVLPSVYSDSGFLFFLSPRGAPVRAPPAAAGLLFAMLVFFSAISSEVDSSATTAAAVGASAAAASSACMRSPRGARATRGAAMCWHVAERRLVLRSETCFNGARQSADSTPPKS